MREEMNKNFTPDNIRHMLMDKGGRNRMKGNSGISNITINEQIQEEEYEEDASLDKFIPVNDRSSNNPAFNAKSTFNIHEDD